MAAGAIQEWSYRGVRFVHLALSTALVPSGLAFWLQNQPQVSPLVLAPAWILANMVLLFALPMDQNRYPIGLVSALFRTGPMVICVIAAIGLRKNLLGGAFFGASSMVAGLALFLTVMALLELNRKGGKDAEGEETERRRLTERLLLPLAALSWVAFGCSFPMLFAELNRGAGSPPVLMLTIWAFQALSTTQFWFGQSTWTKIERDARTELFEASWSGPTAAFFTAGFLGVTAVTLWLGLGR